MEQKRLEAQKKTQERNLSALHEKFADSVVKAARQYPPNSFYLLFTCILL